MKTRTLTLMAALLLGLAQFSPAADSLNETLQKGLFEEEANHNLEAAIKAYQAVVEHTDEQRKLAATAIFRLGECYRKLGRTNDATAQYERILREFGDQTTLADLSRQNLLAARARPATAKAGELEAATDQEKLEVQYIKALIKDSPDLINSPGEGGATPLLKAALEGHLAVGRFLLANKANVNAQANGATPLYRAAEFGHKSMVELLLANGANVNLRCTVDDGATALHAAARHGFMSVAEVLIASKADVNAGNDHGQTPLHWAAQTGQNTVAEVLLANGADIQAADSTGETPLHLAVQNSHPAMVNLLLSHKAEVNVIDKNGATPLLSAVMKKNPNIVESLLKSGADVNLRQNRSDGPLRWAIRTLSPQLLNLLLAHKPDLEVQDQDGFTLLQAAIYGDQERSFGNGHVPIEMVESLLVAGANPNALFKPVGNARYLNHRNNPTSASDIAENSPLLVATRKGRADFVEALLAHGADVNATSPEGKSALHYSVENRSLPLVTTILAHHPNTEIRDKEGSTPLRRAQFEDLKIMEALIGDGADPNYVFGDGNSILHYAVRAGRKDIVELLVTNKADVNVMNKEGETPLMWTQRRAAPGGMLGSISPQPGVSLADPRGYASMDEIATFLLRHGADETIPRRAFISVSRKERNATNKVFFKGTNAFNQYTLLEAIAAAYPNIVNPYYPTFPFPDFANLKIKRLPTKPGGDVEMNVNLAEIFDSGECRGDLDLEWGDLVEIPELDHGLNEPWPGLTREKIEMLRKCLKRESEIIVKGEHTKLTLMPALTEASNFALRLAELQVRAQVGAAPAPARDSWRNIMGFRLKDVINQANVVRLSSDLSRVKVKRADPKTGQAQELIFNLSEGAPYDARTDLWLRDGDVIEIPEK